MNLYDDWRFLNLSDESSFEGAASGKNPVWQQITLAWARLADEGKFNCTLCDTPLSIAEDEEGPNFPLLLAFGPKPPKRATVSTRVTSTCVRVVWKKSATSGRRRNKQSLSRKQIRRQQRSTSSSEEEGDGIDIR